MQRDFKSGNGICRCFVLGILGFSHSHALFLQFKLKAIYFIGFFLCFFILE